MDFERGELNGGDLGTKTQEVVLKWVDLKGDMEGGTQKEGR